MAYYCQLSGEDIFISGEEDADDEDTNIKREIINFFMNNSRGLPSVSFLYPTHHPTRLTLITSEIPTCQGVGDNLPLTALALL